MRNWLEKFAPDVEQTFVRFPLAILLSLLSTMLAIALTNDWFGDVDVEPLLRLAFGLSAGAVFAVAGVFFGEAQKTRGPGYVFLAYVLPLAVVGLLQVSDTGWIVSPMALPLGLLWLSCSAFTRFADRFPSGDIQDRFWWLNHRAITTAIIAAVAFGLISLGFVAVERALDVLFGVNAQKLFYEYLLPFTGLFLTPLYWLSTLPKLSDFRPQDISEPDFLSRAIGFLGQFVLTPFLFLYALILLAYGVQIAIARELPQGMLGWMVLGFSIVGAANWLVLHPAFMHKRVLVKYFRALWFWLTLVPLALYWLAVYVRIDVYGLTPERVGLVAGGIWALGLALAFLSKKFADIRFIPGFALAIIAFFSIGPWNFINLPQVNQAARLDAAIYNAMAGTQSVGGPYEWTDQTAQTARGAIGFLISYAGDREKLAQVLKRHGLDVEADKIERYSVLRDLGLRVDESDASEQPRTELSVSSDFVFDASQTPFVLRDISLRRQSVDYSGALRFQLAPGGFRVSIEQGGEKLVPVQPWLDQQDPSRLSRPALEFEFEGATYRLVIRQIEFYKNTDAPLEIIRLRGRLYSDRHPEGGANGD